MIVVLTIRPLLAIQLWIRLHAVAVSHPWWVATVVTIVPALIAIVASSVALDLTARAGSVAEA